MFGYLARPDLKIFVPARVLNIFSSPYHPQSNGLAERFIQTFKTSISKSLDEDSNLEDAVVDCLGSYRAHHSIVGSVHMKCCSDDSLEMKFRLRFRMQAISNLPNQNSKKTS
ncbi:hypothetical protein RF11_04929 [Thelohanellus kitauei]|uniref:Integrase catalytic domain-containing protein n=1 Tax=Thelohanellus kitauei TaxID=669202 RepID=A0A0C2N2H5_THEKT|nr:hypothetical protein RF11_04929 [Thelohanellus kitauei]